MWREKPVYVTEKGLAELKEELAFLQETKRPQVIERLQESRGGGDWMDNSEYMLVGEELAYVDGRIQELTDMVDRAQIIAPENEDDVVDVGETVVVQLADGTVETFTIVGVAEADPARGLISNESPLGRALLNHRVGDDIIVNAPMGKLNYRIVALKLDGKKNGRHLSAK